MALILRLHTVRAQGLAFTLVYSEGCRATGFLGLHQPVSKWKVMSIVMKIPNVSEPRPHPLL